MTFSIDFLSAHSGRVDSKVNKKKNNTKKELSH